jgi:hypothetical protein
MAVLREFMADSFQADAPGAEADTAGLDSAAPIRSFIVFQVDAAGTATMNGVRNRAATGSKVCKVWKPRDLYRCGVSRVCE